MVSSPVAVTIKMGKEMLNFGYIEIEEKNYYCKGSRFVGCRY